MPGNVKSAVRAIEILEYFAAGEGAATVGQIAAALGYPQSSTTFLLQTLSELGYLDYDGSDRRYRSTNRIAMLGVGLAADLTSRDGAVTAMTALLEATDGPVLLGQRRGVYVEYLRIAHHPATTPLPYQSRVRRRPLVRSALGKALLAGLPDDEIGRIVHRINADEREPERRVRLSAVLEEMTKIRLRGYADVTNHIPGQASIAVCLPPRAGEAPVALGLTATAAEMPRREAEFAALLRARVQFREEQADRRV